MKDQRTVRADEAVIWLDSHGDYLFRYALSRVHDHSTAEDLVQETLLAALASIKGFANSSSIRTWLTGILKHKIVDHYRHSVRMVSETPARCERSYFDDDGNWHADAAPCGWGRSPERELECREICELVLECLSRVNPHLAAVFTLREIDGLGQDEICRLLSISPSNYWVMLHRARLSLRAELEEVWQDNPATPLPVALRRGQRTQTAGAHVAI